METLRDRLRHNLESVRERIARAAARGKRTADEVRLVAVTKYAAWDWVVGLHELGHRDFGESRPQQLVKRSQRGHTEGAPPWEDVRWHLIGHLQRNKVRHVLPLVSLIHSVDSLNLARRIDDIASQIGLRPDVLFEVNISGELSKDGFPVDQLKEQWHDITALPHLRPCGLMTMAPRTDDQQLIRSVFSRLRQLRDELADDEPTQTLTELSMGMSSDFEIAIEEGATIVRIGSLLFQGLSES